MTNYRSRLSSSIRVQIGVFALPLAMGAVALICAAQGQKHAPVKPACDASCLTGKMDDFLTRILAHQVSAVRIAPDAPVYLNTRALRVDEIPLLRVKAIKSKQVFADPVTGNVVARTGVELTDGKVAYASIRLRIAGGDINQIEMSFDDSPRVVPSYVRLLDPLMTTIVPADKRQSRELLKSIVERYFQALTDHHASAADFDDRCERYHSGQRITNNPRNTVEEGAPMTCFTAVGGNPPWGPATDIHIPVVDQEHGIVVGYTVLLYKDGTPPMYVSEVFKILDGRIRMIDNIGIKEEEIQAMNFPM